MSLPKKNVFERFRQFYQSLPNNEKSALYYAIAAVRGPDMEESSYSISSIKADTTFRVRALMFGDEFEIPIGNPSYTLNDIRSVAGSHFTTHLYEAQEFARMIGVDLKLLKKDDMK